MWQAYDLLAFFGDCIRFHTRAVIAIGVDDAHLSVLDFNDVFAVVAIDLESAVFVQSIRISQFSVNVNLDRKSTRLNSSHWNKSRMPSSA